MADLTVTISNRINLLGTQPSNKWGAMTWGVDTWGAGSNGELQDVGKVVAETAGLSTDQILSAVKVTTDSIALTSDLSSITLLDADGYYHVFPGGATDLEDVYNPVWAGVSGNQPTYTKLTASSTSWVQA